MATSKKLKTPASPAKKTPANPFEGQPTVALSGSNKTAFASAPGSPSQPAGKPVPPGSKITISVLLRRKLPLDLDAMGDKRITRAQYQAKHATDPAALKLMLAFAKAYSLTPKHTPNRRMVEVTGTAANLQKAFGVKLTLQTAPDGTVYRVRQGDICIPKSLIGQVDAILGFDNRPQATPKFRVRKILRPRGVAKPRATNISYTPVQVAQLYGLPAGASAKGQTIGIIELGGGFKAADITAYFKALGIPKPKVLAVSVDKGKNKSDGPNGADGEVMLDIEVAAAVATGATIVVYFAPNTDQGFIDAVATAVHDSKNNPSVISISWGGPESTWTTQAANALDAACQSAAALGITVLAAAGDNGSTDGVTDGKQHADFPASSPHVLACGGTKLNGSGTSITSEVVWNETANNEGATGGGISVLFPQPTWQSGIAATKSGRGVPDVSGNADPSTGYQVRVDGESTVIGGTSAVAPLWAGILAVSNAQSKTTAGFLQPKLYAAKNVCRDITEGDNGAFQAGPGWDACTGLGSPNIPNLFALLHPAKASKPTKGKANK